MAEQLAFRNEAAAGYERAFGQVSTHFVPFLLRAGFHLTDQTYRLTREHTNVLLGTALKAFS